jgi:hypothetical protein
MLRVAKNLARHLFSILERTLRETTVPKLSASQKSVKVPLNARLVATLTRAVKQHLLNSGVEPALMNDEVIRTALREYNAAQAHQDKP